MALYTPSTPRNSQVALTWEEDEPLGCFYKPTFEHKPTENDLKDAKLEATKWTCERFKFAFSDVKFVQSAPAENKNEFPIRVRLQDRFASNPPTASPPNPKVRVANLK